jgi:hypothetical protein
MPYASKFDDVYTMIENTVESVRKDIKCQRADQVKGAGKPRPEMVRSIREADLIIADVTGGNPNVMWEVGYATALEKPVILINQKVKDSPFNLGDERATKYSRGSLAETLRPKLAEAIRQTLDTRGQNVGMETAMARPIEIRKFDSIDMAVNHVTRNLPLANSILDVCVRGAKKTQDYGETLDEFSGAANQFLNRRGNKWRQYVGRQYDEQYVSAISRALENAKSPDFKCRRLRPDSFFMSFIILDYGTRAEVLFGWGQKKGVYLCSSRDVVEVFRHFEETLKEHAEEINLFPRVAAPEHQYRYLSGQERFWFPHFRDGAPTAIVYTAPLFFRIFAKDEDKDHRFFIRDIDINDTEIPRTLDDLKDDLKKKADWPKIELSDFQVSRAYVPCGEAFAKDDLMKYLQKCGQNLEQKGHIVNSCDFESTLYHKEFWGPVDVRRKPIHEYHLIFLGNSRANPKAQQLLEGFRYQLKPKGIIVTDPTDVDRDRLAGYAKPNGITKSCIELNENWNTESMVLVTRGPAPGDNRVATSILANQGQGVHAVLCEYLANANHETKWHALVKEFNLPPPPNPFPAKLQMIFHVVLGPDELHWRKCECLTCDF